MRNLKFRAWNGTSMLYSDDNMLFQCKNGEWIVMQTDGSDAIYFAESRKGDTIMQSTNLKDKNGKEIYEGDIVKYNKKTITYIRFFEEYGMYCLVAKTRDGKEYADGHGGSSTRYSPYILSEYHRKRLEIIGNIYENPELCK